jgi:hypothetical protein
MLGKPGTFWLRGLEDKARELERQRRLRIELGILSDDEEQRIERAIEQLEEFVIREPEPVARNEQRAQRLAERVEKLIAGLEKKISIQEAEEQDDEEQIGRLFRGML